MKKKFTSVLILLLALAVVVSVGCTKKKSFVPVEGTLTLDGEPFEGATVCFTPVDEAVGVAAAGTTDASGHFVVTTGVDVGCVPGDYKVTVFKIETSGDSVLTAKSTNTFPAQYADPETSGLTASIVKKMEPLKFDLTK
ncbi:MAG: carboxypeptidase-like regulatory domain-containing protein [Thermoguttaceae bacterium]|jgi:hypothetical protein|nr:carboxypeptidase-like regulatory domain-containing protein [Thermoguttaceae bacterium]